ncbi:hypothetical protein SSS_00302 [Sarcoptes scabiei]|uniref:Uncharacterized protein n=2 Tax=Sarcoptes scabiei TaxID=52283 RepID=A0A834RKG0_SARSC|nr:hypothetical protein SSS_00302 [Sarcoptes scabiei]
MFGNDPKKPYDTNSISSKTTCQTSVTANTTVFSSAMNQVFNPLNRRFDVTAMHPKFFNQPNELRMNQEFKRPINDVSMNYLEELFLENLSIISQNSFKEEKKFEKNETEIKKNSNDGDLGAILEEISQFKRMKTSEIFDLNERNSNLQNEIENLKQTIQSLNEQNQKISAEKCQLDSVLEEKMADTMNIQQNFQKFSKKLDWFKRNSTKISEELNNLKQLNESMSEEKSALQKKVHKMKSQIADLETEYERESMDLSAKLDEKQTEIEKLKQSHADEIEILNTKSEEMIGQTKEEYEKKIEDVTLILQNEREKNNVLQSELTLSRDELQATKKILEDLENQIVFTQNEINHKYQELEDMKSLIAKEKSNNNELEIKYDKIEKECFNLVEDIKKLYCLRTKSSKIIQKLESDMRNCAEENQIKITKLENASMKIRVENEELIEKNRSLEESLKFLKESIDQSNEMFEAKKLEHLKIIEEKDKVIADYKRQIDDNLIKIRLVQDEKEKMFRNFHELILTSYRQSSSLAISSVAPITNSAQDLKHSEDQKCFSAVSQFKRGSIVNKTSTDAQKTDSNVYSERSDANNVLKNRSVIDAEEISTLSSIQSPKSTPIKSIIKTKNSNLSTIPTSSNNIDDEKYGDNAKDNDNAKRTHEKSSDSLKSNDSKSVRFSDNVMVKKIKQFDDDEKSIVESTSSKTNNLLRYSRNRNSKSKSEGFDMSFVRRKLDNENQNSILKTAKKNSTKQEIAWIDSIYAFE